MNMASFVFFYPLHSAPIYIANLVTGRFEPPADRIDFIDPSGGSESRELAIPFLAGMDEVRIDAAEIRLRSGSLEVESNSHITARGPGSQGVFLGLASPGLLRKVVLEYAPPAPQVGVTFRLIVRLASRAGTGFTAGVPIFAEPVLPSLGPMYGPALPGFTLAPVATNRVQLTLPSLMGDAWLFQIASGNTPDALAPQPIVPAIRAVVLDAAPKDVVVNLVASSGDTVLWSNPGLLLPGGQAQVISFTPLAQRHLAEKLKTIAASSPALSISLNFASAAAGRLEITAKTLSSNYIARPFGMDAKRIAVSGDRAAFTFDLPAGFTPTSNNFKLTLRAKPRKRDPLSPDAPMNRPVSGLRVGQSEHVAAGMPISGEAAVTAVRLCLAATSEVEAVLALRADAAGAPGEQVAAPAVFHLSPALSSTWIDVELPAPLPPGATKLWISLRTNKGDLDWYTDPHAAGEPFVSRDEGRSWIAAPDILVGPARLLSQLMIEADPIADPPRLVLLAGDTVLHSNLLAGITGASPGEFVVPSASMPLGSLSVAASPGSRTSLHFALSSVYQCEATIEDFAVVYDPTAGHGAL
jgi:hypothetical protein